MRRAVAVLTIALLVSGGARATAADSLGPWLSDASRAVADAHLTSVVIQPLDGVVGQFLTVRLAAALAGRLADPQAVAAALRAVPRDQATDPARVLATLAPLGVDGLLTGELQRAADVLRVQLCLSRADGVTSTLPIAELPLDGDLLALCGDSHAVDERRGLRPSLKEVVELARQPAEHLPPALDRSCPFQLELLVDGVARQPERRDRDAVVRLSPGESYALRVTNRNRERVGVALFIDGLNTVGQMRERPSAGLKWIVEPGQTVEVAGWQVGDRRQAFTVVGGAESVAGRLGLTDQLGLITASFYAEAAADQPGPGPQVGGEERRDLPFGTGAGAAERRAVTRVKFTPAETPAATLALRYEVSEAKIGG